MFYSLIILMTVRLRNVHELQDRGLWYDPGMCHIGMCCPCWAGMQTDEPQIYECLMAKSSPFYYVLVFRLEQKLVSSE